MVKQGYKQTEIGVIPEDWETIPFEKCFKILSNNTLSRAELNENSGTVKNIHYGDILVKYNSILNCSDKNIPYINKPSKNISPMYLIDGDLVIADTAEDETVGKAVEISNIGERKIESGLHTIPCRALSQDMFANGWLGYYINHSTYHDQLLPFITGTKVSSISKSSVSGTLILVPPLGEQERIAEALSDVDNMISSLEKLIEKKKAVKKGAMQELLTGKKRMPGFTGEWKRIKFKDTGVLILKGQTITQKEISIGTIPVIAGGKNPAYYCNQANRHGRNITISTSGASAGFVNMYDGDIFASDCSTIGESSTYNIDFIYSVLLNIQMDIFAAQTGGAQPHIHPNDIYDLNVLYSFDVKEQTSIASVLSDMDNEIEALEQKLAKTRQLKQGMMQQLLTGKIRLIEKETITDITARHDKLPKTKTGHNHQFDDAVMIAAIVNSFYSEKYPLGRKKVQKLLYLLRRKQEADTSEFKKKAAGPYADEIRYKGGEPIAKKNGYISATTTPKGTSFSKGKKIDAALSYVEKWQIQSDIDWLVSNFKYVGVNDLELYATIDMAICDLEHEGIAVSVDSVKELIRSNDEWKAKLTKTYFSDADIVRAIAMSKRLYS